MMDDEDMKPAASADDEDDHEHDPHHAHNTQHQSFSPLQSRRLPQPSYRSALCPTMDLLALALGNVGGLAGGDSHHHTHRHHSHHTAAATTSNRHRGSGTNASANAAAAAAALLEVLSISVSPSVTVHRTISWQKLLTLGSADLARPPADEYEEIIARGGADGEKNNEEGRAEEEMVSPWLGPVMDDLDDASASAAASSSASTDAPRGATALCWSPDGRSFAVGLADGGVLIHDVERSTGMVGSAAADGSGGAAGGAVHALPPGPAVVAPPLPTPPLTDTAADTSAASATPAKPAKVTTRSMAASRRLRSARKGSRGGGGTRGTGATASDDDSATLPLWKRSAITGLTWARVGPPHPAWEITEEEEEMEDAWRYRSKYLDRSSVFLPPCSYSPSVQIDENFPPSHPHHHGVSLAAADDEEADEAALDRMARPTCRTPLSVLCVATCTNGTSLYLHGRYRILTIAPPAWAACNVEANVSCSADLGTYLTSYTALAVPTGGDKLKGGPNIRTVLSLCTVPSIPRYRYELQTIAALYCSIMAHVRAIGKGLREATSSWTGALRQLDMKFENVVKLLRDYGAVPMTEVPMDADATTKANAVRSAMRAYIVSARSLRTTDSSSALDQFFGAPLMNDQLLQRLIRTLETSASSVEGQIRRNVLAPSRSLVWDSSELKGLVGAMSTTVFDSVQLMDPASVYDLCRMVESLHLIIQACLRDIVDARCRLRDVLGWIRSTASSVKAQGTAPDSALRENARKRRVDDAVVKRVAGSFTGGVSPCVEVADEEHRNLTECVLGIPLSDYFATGTSEFSDGSDLMEQDEPTMSIRESVGTIANQVASIFQQPRTALAKSVERLDIDFTHKAKDGLSSAMKSPIYIHKRIGLGSTQNSDSDDKCFNPNISNERNDVRQRRHWFMIAKVGENRVDGGRSVVQVVALPVASHGSVTSLSDNDANESSRPSYYLETFVCLPPGCSVSDIRFYGDDGSSSLSTVVAEAVGEGRQGIALLIERSKPSEAANSSSFGGGQVAEELLLFSYDDLPYRFVSSEASADEKLVISELGEISESDAPHCVALQDETDSGWPVKRRVVRVYPKLWSNSSTSNGFQASRFALSGSRGIGGVFSEAASSMDLFDLEEDEEEEEEEEDQLIES